MINIFKQDNNKYYFAKANRYFKNERSYERALINQLYGQFYMIQGDFYSAIPWFEKAVQFGYLNLPGEIQTRSNLAAAYFQAGRYDDVIKTLLMTQEMGMKRGIDLSASNFVMLGMAYYQLNDIQPAYKYISKGNDVSEKLNEDWLQYEFGLAVKLKKYNEAIEVGQFLIFVNPEKKSYWKQLSGVYYGSESEELSLAGLELAYENEVLDKEKDYIDLARYFMYKELPIKAVDVLNNGISIEKVKNQKMKSV